MQSTHEAKEPATESSSRGKTKKPKLWTPDQFKSRINKSTLKDHYAAFITLEAFENGDSHFAAIARVTNDNEVTMSEALATLFAKNRLMTLDDIKRYLFTPIRDDKSPFNGHCALSLGAMHENRFLIKLIEQLQKNSILNTHFKGQDVLDLFAGFRMQDEKGEEHSLYTLAIKAGCPQIMKALENIDIKMTSFKKESHFAIATAGFIAASSTKNSVRNQALRCWAVMVSLAPKGTDMNAVKAILLKQIKETTGGNKGKKRKSLQSATSSKKTKKSKTIKSAEKSDEPVAKKAKTAPALKEEMKDVEKDETSTITEQKKHPLALTTDNISKIVRNINKKAAAIRKQSIPLTVQSLSVKKSRPSRTSTKLSLMHTSQDETLLLLNPDLVNDEDAAMVDATPTNTISVAEELKVSPTVTATQPALTKPESAVADALMTLAATPTPRHNHSQSFVISTLWKELPATIPPKTLPSPHTNPLPAFAVAINRPQSLSPYAAAPGLLGPLSFLRITQPPALQGLAFPSPTVVNKKA